MKNYLKKLTLLFLLTAIISMPFNCYAEEIDTSEPEAGEATPEPVPSPTPTPEPTPEATNKPNPTPTPAPEILPRLDSLEVDGFTLDKAFDPENTTYNLTVSASTTSITIKATAIDGCTVYSGNGKHDVLEGKTTEFKVVAKATATDKTQAYTIRVTRPSETLALKSLVVTGYALNEIFSKNVYSYTMTIPYNAQSINVSAVSEESGDTVKITGNENLKVGENTVVITITSSSGKEVSYTIKVTREEEADDISTITSSTSSIATTDDDKNTSGSNSVTKYILITIGCVLLIAIAATGIIFFIKSSNPEKKKAKEALKQAKKDALAKSINNENSVKETVDSVNEEKEVVADTLESNNEEKNDNELLDEITLLEEVNDIDNVDATKKAPKIDDDILDGMDDIFDDKD